MDSFLPKDHLSTKTGQLQYLAATVVVMICTPGPGLAGDGVVALQTADPSCPDDSGNRYVDCGNGTVTDNDTGLVWLADANCLDVSGGGWDWFTAMEFVAGLSDKPATSAAASEDCGLSDGSSPGEWRLPSVEELEAMIADAVDLGCDPTITNDAGNDCWDAQCVTAGACSFSGVVSSFYWSASTSVEPLNAWEVSALSGLVRIQSKTAFAYVWPVRGGQ